MLHKLEFQAMGCQVLAVVENPASPDALQYVPDWFEEWEQAFSRFRFDSELNTINHSNGRPMHVSSDFAKVFETARQAEWISAGLVTPVLFDALVNAGYDRSFEMILPDPTMPAPEALQYIPRLKDVHWDGSTRMIWLPPDLHLDFGGVAKGWAVEQAAKRLAPYGAALVDAGGDIAITGFQRDGGSWEIGIANPFNPSENLEVLNVGGCGVATSGRDGRNWVRAGKRFHHIIDPQTGLPAVTDVLTATVVAPTVTEAEAVAKTLLIRGSEAAMEWLEINPQYSAMLALEDGKRLVNNSMEFYLSRVNEC
jgi:FAD:protein FMN transferase